ETYVGPEMVAVGGVVSLAGGGVTMTDPLEPPPPDPPPPKMMVDSDVAPPPPVPPGSPGPGTGTTVSGGAGSVVSVVSGVGVVADCRGGVGGVVAVSVPDGRAVASSVSLDDPSASRLTPIAAPMSASRSSAATSSRPRRRWPLGGQPRPGHLREGVV